MMKKTDAIRAILDGRKVYHEDWNSGEYIQWDDTLGVIGVNAKCILTDGLPAIGWKIYEQATRTIVIEKWLLSNKTNTEQWVWSGSPSYFEKMPNGFRKIKFLESYEVVLP